MLKEKAILQKNLPIFFLIKNWNLHQNRACDGSVWLQQLVISTRQMQPVKVPR